MVLFVGTCDIVAELSRDCVRYNRDIRRHVLKHSWGNCPYRAQSVKAKRPGSMCTVEAGRKSSSRTAWLYSKTVSKTSKQPTRSSEKRGGVGGGEQQSCGAPSSAGLGRPHRGHTAAVLGCLRPEGVGPAHLQSRRRDGLTRSTLPRQPSANGLWGRGRYISQWYNDSASCLAQVKNSSSFSC